MSSLIRRRQVVVPEHPEEFRERVEALLGRMVMSRTVVDGEPVRRERQLLAEPAARRSLWATWRRVRRLTGHSVDITIQLFRNRYGSVERVLIGTTQVEPTPPPQPHVDVPDFVRFDPRMEHLRRRRAQLRERLAAAQERAYTAGQYAAQQNSRDYERDPSSQRAQDVQEFAGQVEALTGGRDPAGHGASVAADSWTRRQLEEEAQRREAEVERLEAELHQVNEEIRAAVRQDPGRARTLRRRSRGRLG